MITEETSLLKVKPFLSSLDHVRAEWSLEVSENGVLKRPYVLFWVGNQNSMENQHVFNQVTRLLASLDCPLTIRNKQFNLSSQSITQGIGIPTNYEQNRYCLYIHYKQDDIEKYEAFKWGTGAQLEHSWYDFLRLNNVNINHLNKLIKNELQPIFKHILEDKRLFLYSGIWTKYTADKEQEFYVTFPWHPPLQEGLHKVKQFVNSNAYKNMLDMKSLNFRHIGFSSIYSGKSCLTFYFGSTISSDFSGKFEAIEKDVNLGSDKLHRVLMKQYPRL